MTTVAEAASFGVRDIGDSFDAGSPADRQHADAGSIRHAAIARKFAQDSKISTISSTDGVIFAA